MLSCFKAGGGEKRQQSDAKLIFHADPNEHRDSGEEYVHTRSIVYGRDDDKNRIKAILLDSNGVRENENILRSDVIPIVGIAGIGKTTLARYVYKDEQVVDGFPHRRWVAVTENLDIGSVARKLLGRIDDSLDIATLMEQLVRSVVGMTFLFVLDDVWDGGLEELVQLTVRLLEVGAQGSKIIVTTRSEGVARRFPRRGSVYSLQGMSVEDCWQLFKSRAFSRVREETPQLESIGREMIGKFQGVPLIALSLGSLLRCENDRSYWQKVLESEIWSMPDLASKTLSALRLSYDRLPTHLKRCFEYCSLFPKGLGIQGDLLAELWMSEGIVSVSQSMAAEDPTTDHGRLWLEQLVDRSFFQEEEASEIPDPTRRAYTMHSLYHDLAQSIAGEELRSVNPGHQNVIPEGCRRLGVVCEWLTSSIPKIPRKTAKNLQTLVLVMRDYWVDPTHKCLIGEVPAKLLSSLSSLRVLDLSSIGITALPNSIGKLRHLIYLNLSQTSIDELPESIGNLRALEWLILRSCKELVILPESIRKLQNLRVLDLTSCFMLVELPGSTPDLLRLSTLRIEGFTLLDRMPRGMGRMMRLHILSKFIVNEDEGCSLAELEQLDGLSGCISICKLERVKNKDVEVAKKANLRGKNRLRRLELYWGHFDDPGEEAASAEYHVLEGLQPHPNLEELAIRGYAGGEWPGWMSTGMLENLVDLKLSVAVNCKHLPPLGILPCLKSLKIESLDAVIVFGPDAYGSDAGAFPKLEELEICAMPSLEEWSLPRPGATAADELNRIPFGRLNYLEIHQCPKLSKLPPLRFPLLDVLRVSESSAELLSETSCSGGLGLPSLEELIIVGIQVAGPFTWEGLKHVTTVKKLAISHCRELQQMPDSIRHLSSLRSLELRHCPSLTKLPLWFDFPTLQSLKIFFCTMLTGLPEALRRLPGLRSVGVEGGSELWSQYSVGEEDWGCQNGLTHIPNIRFHMWCDLTADGPEQEWDGAMADP